MMKVTGGKRKTLHFLHGTCGLLGPKGWHPISGGDCDCRGCKRTGAPEDPFEIPAMFDRTKGDQSQQATE
jgi:hypothetical protein